MREIKFRAWDKKEKRYWSQEEMCEIGGFYYHYGVTPDPEYFCLQQYTGFRDKNGVEIYEGDVFIYTGYNRKHKCKACGEVEGEDLISTIEYIINDTQAGFCYSDINTWTGEREYHSFDEGMAKASEVIGNIYENPELLKQNNEKKEETTNNTL